MARPSGHIDAKCHLEFRAPHSALRTGFTLIELLVVIAIIGILAGLIVGTASIAMSNKAKSLAQAQLAAMETAIDSYKKAKGFYPPDNTNDTALSPLFYELTGTTAVLAKGQISYYESPLTLDKLPAGFLSSIFNVNGFINCSNSTENPSINFYPGLKKNQYEQIANNNATIIILGLGISGPLQYQPATSAANPFILNPWHYNSSHPTNNVDSYDLWMDVKYSGKTNRICNWSKDPIVVSY